MPSRGVTANCGLVVHQPVILPVVTTGISTISRKMQRGESASSPLSHSYVANCAPFPKNRALPNFQEVTTKQKSTTLWDLVDGKPATAWSSWGCGSVHIAAAVLPSFAEPGWKWWSDWWGTWLCCLWHPASRQGSRLSVLSFILSMRYPNNIVTDVDKERNRNPATGFLKLKTAS